MIAVKRTWTIGWWVACYRAAGDGWLVYYRWVERAQAKGRGQAEALLEKQKAQGVRHPSTLIARRRDDLSSLPASYVTEEIPVLDFIGGEA